MPILILLLLGFQSLFSHDKIHEPLVQDREIFLFEGLGHLHHPVSTSNAEAQAFFDQGLKFKYAFNHDAAYWSFLKASKIDPDLAMAYWGMALSLGSNINKDVSPEEEEKAYQLIQKALELSKNATPIEQDYIKVLAKRYTQDPNADLQELEKKYASAMVALSQKYPDDLDAATLAAESILTTTPWKWWDKEGTPKPGVKVAVEAIESVLKKDPNHIGANHYYIHALEPSKHPEYALMSAKRLEQLVPNSGHMQHMPSHIYFLVGDYHSAANANEKAIQSDLSYIKVFGLEDTYPHHYLGHNLDFLARAYAMEGRYEKAKAAADKLANFSKPFEEKLPMLEFRMTIPSIWVRVRFQKWNDILQLPQPNPELKITNAIWHAARSMAYAGLKNIPKALEEKKKFEEIKNNLPSETEYGTNQAKDILEITNLVLLTRIEESKNDLASAIEHLKQAVQLEDTISYNEPSDWFYPLRETLGGLLLQAKDYPAAEIEFRKVLEEYPRNGRALFGLIESLKGQNKSYSLYELQKQFNEAWKYAEAPLTITDL